MKRHGYALGGEQSGHVIILDHATTGDGTLTGLLLAARVAQTGRTLRDLASVMERLPQVLINVPDVDRSRVNSSAELATAVADAERELGTTGRVLLRPPAPSRSSVSWSRPPTSTTPVRWPPASPTR